MSHTECGVSYMITFEYSSYRLTKRSCFSRLSDILIAPHKSKGKEGASLMIVKSWSQCSVRAHGDDWVERLLRFSFPGRRLVAWRFSNLLVELPSTSLPTLHIIENSPPPRSIAVIVLSSSFLPSIRSIQDD